MGNPVSRGVVAWVRFWDQREHPRTLALVRILLALVVLFDFVEIWRLGLVTPLLGVQEVGGWADVMGRKATPPVYWFLPPEAWVPVAHHALLVLSAFCLLIGFFTRTSSVVLMLLWVQIQLTMPMSDRAIDLLCRNILMIFAFSGAGNAWSVDARMSQGTWRGGAEIGSWARYLIITQLVIMYFTAGVQKVGFSWLPWGYFTALYIILQDPAIARFDFSYLRNQPFFFATQVGTFVTMIWQWAYPLVFLWYWYKNTAERPGRLRAFANRWHLHLVWVAVGALFHVLLAVTMELGIFPWAMLALYPAFIDPDELKHLWTGLRDRIRPAEESVVTG